MATADEEFLAKLNAAFAVEAAEHLQTLSSGLLELEIRAGRRAAARKSWRQSFAKRTASKARRASVNRADIESVCQAMESVFSSWKRGAASNSRMAFDVLGRGVEFLGRLIGSSAVDSDQREIVTMVQQIRDIGAAGAKKAAPPQPDAVPPQPNLPAMDAPNPAGGSPATAQTVRIATAKMDALLLQTEEMLAVKNTAAQRVIELRELTQITGTWQREWRKTEADLRTFRRTAQTGAEKQTAPARLVEFLEWNHSVFRSLDHKLAMLSTSAEADRRLIGGMVDDLLEDAKQLVMLPFSTLLDQFPRQVRDLAREQGKEVELALRGREIEIDKRILEEMKDPLTHLVRNSVDHGIETPAGAC